MKYLTGNQLNSLKTIDTPTVANAAETHETRLNTEGFMGWNIRCQFPDLGIMVGQAVTATLNTTTTGKTKTKRIWYDCLQAIEEMPSPSVIVAKDIGPRPFHGCHFGDVMAGMATRVGCIGLVTDGGVRDVETIHEIGFQMFAAGTVPAHGNFGLDETQIPVEVGGVLVNPGDVIHADLNGVVVFPLELTDHVILESAKIADFESSQHKWISSESFSIKALRNRSKRPLD